MPIRLERIQKDTIPTIDTLTEVTNPIKTHITGNPYTILKTITTAGSPEDVNVNAQLGRNAHKGYIEAYGTNTGIIKIKLSNDGINFTNEWIELEKGDVLDITDLDVHTIKLDCTVDGEKAFIMVI